MERLSLNYFEDITSLLGESKKIFPKGRNRFYPPRRGRRQAVRIRLINRNDDSKEESSDLRAW